MSSRYALVNGSGVVENVILWDGDTGKYTPPGTPVPLNNTASHRRCEIGDTYNGTTFAKPPAPVPQSAGPIQLRRVLRSHAQAAAIRSYFQSLTADQKEDWQLLRQVRRDHPLILGMQSALGATDAQIDNLFRAAVREPDD